MCLTHRLIYPINLLRQYTTINKNMQELFIDNVHSILNPGILKIARSCLLNGDIIALPTDTVYGLACDANNEEAIRQLYHIKGRDGKKPVAICVKDHSAIRRYGFASHLSDSLLKSLLPGPITIVIEKTPKLNNRFLNPNTSKIGIRIPNFKFIRELCAFWGEKPLALSSANRSAEPSSLDITEFKILWPQLAAIIDAGRISYNENERLGSTVIDLATPGCYKILRSGVALQQTLDILHAHGINDIDN